MMATTVRPNGRAAVLMILVNACLCGGSCRSECPDGWVNFNDHSCLKFSAAGETKSWADAAATCRLLARGSRLVALQDAADNAELNRLVAPYSVSWTGLNDVAAEGEWEWAGESPRRVWVAGADYEAFGPGEPNNHAGDEDCVTFLGRYPDEASWNDLLCSRENSYICYMSPLWN